MHSDHVALNILSLHTVKEMKNEQKTNICHVESGKKQNQLYYFPALVDFVEVHPLPHCFISLPFLKRLLKKNTTDLLYTHVG
jgi:hypothetical protein